MCSDHSLVASYSDPKKISPRFGAYKSLMLTFLFEFTNWSLGNDFAYNSNGIGFLCVLCVHEILGF